MDTLVVKLRKIREPETYESIIELGLVDRIEEENGKIVVYTNFNYIRSSCKACVPINWLVIRSIVRKIERVLREEGRSFRIVESGTNEVWAEG